MSNKHANPLPPATCPVCRTPLNRLRIAFMGGRHPRIQCRTCGALLQPDRLMHRIWSIISILIFFALLFLIVRVARLFIIFRVLLILGVGILMLAFSSSFMIFEEADKLKR